jgi:hypothetical protein
MEKYRMQEVLIDRKCAAPRFVIKPQSTFALEGQSAKFNCRIISLTSCTVSWYRRHKSFYGRKLRMGRISWRVCSWQVFPK